MPLLQKAHTGEGGKVKCEWCSEEAVDIFDLNGNGELDTYLCFDCLLAVDEDS
jgi:hypothetical protein